LHPFLLGADQAGQVAPFAEMREGLVGMIEMGVGESQRFVFGETRHFFEQGAILGQGFFQGLAELGKAFAFDGFRHGVLLCWVGRRSTAILAPAGKVFVTATPRRHEIQNRLAARLIMVARMAVLNPNATSVCKVPTRRISLERMTMSAV